MNIVVLDFETYFDDEYSLKKMTTENYVRDPRFKVLGMGVRFVNGDLKWFEDPDEFLHNMREPGDDTAVLCHHAAFDGLILSHHYGVKPRVWFDTLSMARLLIGNHLSVGLDNLARHFLLAGKTVPYDLFKGRHWAELSADTQRLLAGGCLHDVELTWDIFCRLAKDFPQEEYPIIDSTIRMFTEPVLQGDVELLGQVWSDEDVRKRNALADLGVSSSDLQSADKFCSLLLAEGIEPETKAGKNGPIYAFAKTDEFMKDLLEHEDDRIRTLAEARLGLKSTGEQTRAERLGYMAQRGDMCVYLAAYAAHTTRWGGGDKVNFQNFKRGGRIRKALKAPPGHKIIKADKSQAECRFLNIVAGQMDVIERFRNGEDPYIGIASAAYGEEIYKPSKGDPREKEMETKRGTGKQLELSCGFGAGAETIVATAARGTYGPSVKISLDTGYAWRDLYRSTHPFVTNLWKEGDWVLSQMAQGNSTIWRDVLRVEGETIYLPNRCPLHYPDLHWDAELRKYVFKTRRGYKGIWGGFLVENVIQALSRVDMSQSLLRLRAHGLRPVILEHDAGAWVVPENEVDRCVELVKVEMCRSPSWLPSIPLGCDISVSERYS